MATPPEQEDRLSQADKHAVILPEQDAPKKIKYPRSVFFIISNEFCERFTYYGLRAVLSIYLRNILGYTDNDSTIIYHTFTMLCYFFPLLGGMLADSILGKFRTILYLSVVYAIGSIVLSLAAVNDAIPGMPARSISILGLVLISIGTGGIKPCVSSFGGDQFQMPEQEKQLAQFFSVFYFAINSGSLVSTITTPILREDVTCFGETSCYSLAFGVPAALMIVATVFFVIGKPMYKIKDPEGNVLIEVSKCMKHALSRKRNSKGEKRDHWMDYADDKYDQKTIDGIKATLGVLFMFIPLPVFWALFDQQGSTWTFQASRMTGELGGWSLKPDQMSATNAILILLFIPLFETVVYPLFSKCNILKTPLQRLGVGGVVASLSFVIAAIVEFQLEPTYAVVPVPGEAQLRIFNGLNQNLNVTTSFDSVVMEPLDVWQELHLSANGEDPIYSMDVLSQDGAISFSTTIQAYENEATSYLIGEGIIGPIRNDVIEKTDDGYPRVRILYDFIDTQQNHTITFNNLDTGTQELQITLIGTETSSESTEILDDEYTVNLDGTAIGTVTLKPGGVYSVTIVEDADNVNNYFFSYHAITSPNTVHMLWLLPQYVVITAGEIMFSITGLSFSYSQAPESMKSVLTSGWLLSVAFGNLIVIIIEGAEIFESQAYEFLLFAGLMLVDMIIFGLMARGYKYVDLSDESDSDKNKKHEDVEKNMHLKEIEKAGLENPVFTNEG